MSSYVFACNVKYIIFCNEKKKKEELREMYKFSNEIKHEYLTMLHSFVFPRQIQFPFIVFVIVLFFALALVSAEFLLQLGPLFAQATRLHFCFSPPRFLRQSISTPVPPVDAQVNAKYDHTEQEDGEDDDHSHLDMNVLKVNSDWKPKRQVARRVSMDDKAG